MGLQMIMMMMMHIHAISALEPGKKSFVHVLLLPLTH
jgi:hypothetical protein